MALTIARIFDNLLMFVFSKGKNIMKKIFFLACIVPYLLRAVEIANKPSNLIILIDHDEFENGYEGAVTDELECSLVDKTYPILASKKLFHNVLNVIRNDPALFLSNHEIPHDLRLLKTPEESHQLFLTAISALAYDFIIKELFDFYLILPKKVFNDSAIIINAQNEEITPLEQKYGLKIQHLKTINLFQEINIPIENKTTKEDSDNFTKEILPALFVSKDKTPISWNIIISGHGQLKSAEKEPEAFGLPLPRAASVLTFFKKKINVEVLFLSSCFLKAFTQDLFSYAPLTENIQAIFLEDKKIPETYPFDIIIQSLGDTITFSNLISRHSLTKSCFVNMGKFFNNLEKRHSKDYFEILRVSKFIQSYSIADTIYHLLPKNSELLLPITSSRDKSIISFTHVCSKSKTGLFTIPSETKMILLYPEKIDFSLIFNASIAQKYPPKIASMAIGNARHQLKEIVFKSTDFPQDQFDFICSLFAPTYPLYSTKEFYQK